MKRKTLVALLLISTLFVATLAIAWGVAAFERAKPVTGGITTRVSIASDGTEANGSSWLPSMSADGRYVAFDSNASNLVPGDTNDSADIFVHDRITGQTTRVSIASDGAEADNASTHPRISGDGRYVAFDSEASNLVLGDNNWHRDVFVHDRVTGETTRVSVASDGTEGHGHSDSPDISYNGRYVAFRSEAPNLVPNDTSIVADIFVYDRLTGEIIRASIASDGTEGDYSSSDPSISSDGCCIAFWSWASNLVPGDTNDTKDVFVHDRSTGETTRVSVASNGAQADSQSEYPSISGDARYVAFNSLASNLVPGDTNQYDDAFVHDRLTGETTRVSVASDGAQADESSAYADISADGRFVAYQSDAENLVPGDTKGFCDVFVYDRMTGQVARASIAGDGSQADSSSDRPRISADGGYVAFNSLASNLVPGDTNGEWDIYIRDLFAGYGVALSGNVVQAGAQGTPITYTLAIKNTGTVSDTYSLALSGASWSTFIDGPTIVSLAAGANSEVTVVVSVPQDAATADMDIVTLTATSQGNPLITDSSELTTIAGIFNFNSQLPVIAKP